MAKARIVAALVVGLSPLLGGCSFVRDLAIDAFLPEARPLIDSLREQAKPKTEVVVPIPPPAILAPPPPVIEARPMPEPPPMPPTILSREDEETRRAIEAYETRLEEIREAIKRRVVKP